MATFIKWQHEFVKSLETKNFEQLLSEHVQCLSKAHDLLRTGSSDRANWQWKAQCVRDRLLSEYQSIERTLANDERACKLLSADLTNAIELAEQQKREISTLKGQVTKLKKKFNASNKRK